MVETTKVFSWLLDQYVSGKRYIGAEGGTSSSKTYSILQLISIIAHEVKGLTISVMSESMPHLKKGAIKDFIDILKSANLYHESNYNRTDQVFTIKCQGGGESHIEFFSADLGKVTGPRRHIAFFNECNNISKAVHDAAEVRTDMCCFYDFNPTHEFWFHSDVLTHPSTDVGFARFTYLDNDKLSESIIKTIESRRERDPEWWRVYGLGLLGKKIGTIFDFERCAYEDLPEVFKRSGMGMDFGFTNDPSTLVKVMLQGDSLFLHQMMYRTGMHTGDILNFLKSSTDMQGKPMHIKNSDEIIADNEPRMISDLKRGGFTVLPAYKAAGSINAGIALIKKYKTIITSGSLETIEEYRNYKWKLGPDGKPINIPIEMWNHTIDPTRYALDYMINGSRQKAPARSAVV